MSIMDLRRERERYWSQSRIGLFLRCSLKFAFVYVYKLRPAFTPAALSFGSSVHRVLEMMSLMRKEENTPSADECADLFGDIWIRQLKEDKNIRFKDGEDADTCRKQGQQIVRTFRDNIDETERVLSVSEALAVPLVRDDEILPEPLIGEIDLLVETAHGNKLVVDWKTAGAKWPVSKDGKPGKADREIQPTALLYAFKQQYGELPGFEYRIVTKSKTPAFQRVATSRCEDDFTRLIRVIQIIDAMVKAEHFLPDDTGFMCGDCQYAEHCRAWHRKFRRVVSNAA